MKRSIRTWAAAAALLCQLPFLPLAGLASPAENENKTSPQDKSAPAKPEAAPSDAKDEDKGLGTLGAPELIERLESIVYQQVPPAEQRKAIDDTKAELEKRFPKHTAKYDVQVMDALMTARNDGKIDKARTLWQQVLDSKEATSETRSKASGYLLSLDFIRVRKEEITPDDWAKALFAHLKAFPKFEANAEYARVLFSMTVEGTDPKSVAKLKEYAASEYPEVADAAKAKLKVINTIAEIKTKPLDLKFTSVDGKEIDVTKMNGKVVLLDFWATWCGPCMVELPNVVAAYEKLHEKGFEILGISLDEDRAALLRTTKNKKMTWPQYFDGKGWQNTIAQRFGIESIPAMWLINKKGMVVDTEARENLADKVEKLLAE